jgi:hypothetical protein
MGLFSFICSWSLLCAMQGMNCSVIESFVSGRFDDCTKDERERLSNDINSLQVCIAHPSLHRALSTCVFFLCYLISIMGTDKWQTKPWRNCLPAFGLPRTWGLTPSFTWDSPYMGGPLIQSLSTKRNLVSAVQTSSYYTHHQSQLTNAIMHEMCFLCQESEIAVDGVFGFSDRLNETMFVNCTANFKESSIIGYILVLWGALVGGSDFLIKNQCIWSFLTHFFMMQNCSCLTQFAVVSTVFKL